MTQFLLDTSPIIAHIRKKIDLRDVLPDDAIMFTSLTTLGELEKGIHRVTDPTAERNKVNAVMADVAVLKPDEVTARHYGRIYAELDSNGNRIPENDIWIAGVAAEYGLELVTGDDHFNRVDGITVRLLTW